MLSIEQPLLGVAGPAGTGATRQVTGYTAGAGTAAARAVGAGARAGTRMLMSAAIRARALAGRGWRLCHVGERICASTSARRCLETFLRGVTGAVA